MRNLLFFLLVCFATSPVFAGDKMKDIWPDTLMNWLRIMEAPHNRLLSAADVEGYFLGVWINENGHLRVADLCYDERVKVLSTKVEIVDISGKNSLLDDDFELLLEDDVEVVNESKSHFGPIRFESSSSIKFLRGQYFKLNNTEERDFLVRLIDRSVPSKPRCFAEVKVTIPERMSK